jgi:hypothetical protein
MNVSLPKIAFDFLLAVSRPESVRQGFHLDSLAYLSKGELRRSSAFR